jgi:hypothetical protein
MVYSLESVGEWPVSAPEDTLRLSAARCAVDSGIGAQVFDELPRIRRQFTETADADR